MNQSEDRMFLVRLSSLRIRTNQDVSLDSVEQSPPEDPGSGSHIPTGPLFSAPEPNERLRSAYSSRKLEDDAMVDLDDSQRVIGDSMRETVDDRLLQERQQSISQTEKQEVCSPQSFNEISSVFQGPSPLLVEADGSYGQPEGFAIQGAWLSPSTPARAVCRSCIKGRQEGHAYATRSLGVREATAYVLQ